MAILQSEGNSESSANNFPLLMERGENIRNIEHVVDITRGNNAAVPASACDGNLEPSVGLSSSVLRTPEPLTSMVSSYVPRTDASPALRIGDRDSHRHQSPLNSRLWICVELLCTILQIVASIIMLALSKNENPHAPLRAWIVGYALGCVALLPLLYWRYIHRNQDPGSAPNREISVQGILTAGSRLSLPFSRSSAATTDAASGSYHLERSNGSRLKTIVEYFKMGLHCFYAIWFVVGNVWIFGGASSAFDAPNLYWLCIVFLLFSCMAYAMPCILCASICCCFPCIISVLSYRENLNQTRGATSESINALPTYKFKHNTNESGIHRDANRREEGGGVAAGTNKERIISAEDAACCICLAKYANNDELRELPCLHFLHKECLDKWLKINATCPLCKFEVGATASNSNAGEE